MEGATQEYFISVFLDTPVDCGLGQRNTGLERFIREPLVCQSKALSSAIL